MKGECSEPGAGGTPWAWWEFAALAAACGSSLALGFSNLAQPSLWHDELVHVFVARSIAETGAAALPGGTPYFSGALFNYLLAAVIRVFGDGEFAVRAPSVCFTALNVVLTYLLVRCCMGRAVAVVAAFGLALSPWELAWARQARFYALQQCCFLALLLCFWHWRSATTRQARIYLGAGGVAAYALGALSSFHSVFFLAPLLAFAALCATASRARRDVAAPIALIAIGLLSAALLPLLMNPTDRAATMTNAGLGLPVLNLSWYSFTYYPLWLEQNLGLGFFLLALAGTLLAPWREGRRGLYVALAFWAPVAALTVLVAYRWQRFMFFAYPGYVALYAYALVAMLQSIAAFRRSILHAVLALVLLAFGLRLAVSLNGLIGDSWRVARGADVSLAARHPQWRDACQWVREHRKDEAVLTTTCLPTMYYLGHVDNWFPSAYIAWERQDSGLPGLATLADLQAFVRQHPKGYFLSDAERFEKWRFHGALQGELNAAVEWVRANMRRIDAASSQDITVYAWGA